MGLTGEHGFLMNEVLLKSWTNALKKAVSTFINPLVMEVERPSRGGKKLERAYALNEVSLRANPTKAGEAAKSSVD